MWLRKFVGVTTAFAFVLVIIRQVESTSDNVCDTPRCVQEAAKVLNYIDSSVNPCQDFYQFACGTLLKNAHGDISQRIWTKLEQREKQQKIEIAQEGILETDHKMVKAEKKLYRACMDENRIKDDFIKIAQEITKVLGGWPVVEGPDWNENNFDWLNATYELRSLGFEYSQFLQLRVKRNSENTLFLRISNDNIHFYRQDEYYYDELSKDAHKVAVLLGASDEEIALKEIKAAEDALRVFNKRMDVVHRNRTIGQIQRSDGVIDWQQFITKLLRPRNVDASVISIDFPRYQYIKRAIKSFQKLPKRVQANYIIWNALQPFYQYVKDIEKKDTHRGSQQTRAEYCLQVASKAFTTSVVNPLEAVRLRRYLSKEKRDKMQEEIFFVVSTLLEAISQIGGLYERKKESYLKQLEETNVVIGLSRDYFDDKIFEDADVDMMDVRKDATFFDLLAQANINHQSAIYETVFKKNYQPLYVAEIPSGITLESDHLYVPSVLSELFFDTERPQYLNHGTFVFVITEPFVKDLWKHIYTGNEYNPERCVSMDMDARDLKEKMPYEVVSMGVTVKFSRFIYNKWIEENGDEPNLIGIDYTPNQLFWISFASLHCKPLPHHSLADSTTLSESLRLNPSFSKDFNCSANSRYSSDKCKVFNVLNLAA